MHYSLVFFKDIYFFLLKDTYIICIYLRYQFSSVQSLSHVQLFVTSWNEVPQASLQFSSVAQLCPTPCDPMNHGMPGLPVCHQLPEFTQAMSIESVMPSSHLILCQPLLLLPSIPPNIRVFSNESTLIYMKIYTHTLDR